MQLLLDTHVLLWWLTDSPKMPRDWRDAIADASSRVCVSAASIWEMAIKIGIGKLSVRLPGKMTLDQLAEACGFEDLPVQAAHAAAVANLPMLHADPFDRLLVAQSMLEGLTVVSADRAVLQYDVRALADE